MGLGKSSQIVSESKQDRIKFDVLLTSYEMINMDTATMKSIKWECMIVDEGQRLKNKDSKLFSSLKQLSCKHRVLLTGTPLQVVYPTDSDLRGKIDGPSSDVMPVYVDETSSCADETFGGEDGLLDHCGIFTNF